MEKARRARRRGRGRYLIIAGFLLIIGIIVAIIINSSKPSCEEGEELKDGKCVVIREVDIYTFVHDYPDKMNQRVELTIEVPKALGYAAKKNDTKIELYRESDRSTISVYTMLTSKNSITMNEADYSKSAWKDYEKTDNDDGSTVVEINKIRSDGSIYGVEWSKAYKEQAGQYWFGVRVTAMASGLDQGKDSSFDGKDYKTFNARETYESDDFQYMLDSIKYSVSELASTAED